MEQTNYFDISQIMRKVSLQNEAVEVKFQSFTWFVFIIKEDLSS